MGSFCCESFGVGPFSHSDPGGDRWAFPRVQSDHRVFELLVRARCCWLSLSAAAVAWFHQRGYTLYYGDAEAHLNIARRVLDSRTPGPFQIGTVWLPSAARADAAVRGERRVVAERPGGRHPGGASASWSPRCSCFAAARRVYGDRGRGRRGALPVRAESQSALPAVDAHDRTGASSRRLCALLYFAVRFRETQSLGWVAAAGVAALAATLTRYEGWFLIPFATLYFLVAAKRRRLAAVLPVWRDCLAGAARLAGAQLVVLRRPLEVLPRPLLGHGDLPEAFGAGMSATGATTIGDTPGSTTGTRCGSRQAGPSLLLGVAGAVAARIRRAFWPLLLLAPAPAFYLWSMYSGGTPIYMPHLWPFSYYNTRYGLDSAAAAGVGRGCAGDACAGAPARRRRAAGGSVGESRRGSGRPRPEGWICWKESQVNSEVRRAWTKEAADFLAPRYRPGTGILIPFGDLAGIFRQAGIPLREALHEDNVAPWQEAVGRPALFLREEWAVTIAGEKVSDAIARAAAIRLAVRLREDDCPEESAGHSDLQAKVMRISFTKAHGAKNDFLLTWASEAPREGLDSRRPGDLRPPHRHRRRRLDAGRARR